MKFARITRFDLVNGTSDIIRLFGDWSVASEDQEEALDKVFRASQATGIGVDELMRLMDARRTLRARRVSPTAAVSMAKPVARWDDGRDGRDDQRSRSRPAHPR